MFGRTRFKSRLGRVGKLSPIRSWPYVKRSGGSDISATLREFFEKKTVKVNKGVSVRS